MSLNTERVRLFLKLLLLAALVVLFVRLVRANLDEFERVLDLGLLEVAAMSGVFFAGVLFRAQLLRRMLAAFEVEIRFAEGIQLVLIRNCAGLLVVKGGLFVYMRHLKRRHEMFYSASISTMILVNTLQIVTGCAGLIVGAVWPAVARGAGDPAVILPVVGGCGLVLTFLYLPEAAYRPAGRLHPWIATVFAQWAGLRRNFGLFLRLLVLQTGFVLMATLNVWLALRFLDVRADFPTVLFLTSAAQVGTVIALTPGALGVREGLMGYAGEVLGVGLTLSVAAASVTRAVGLVWVLGIGGPLLFFWGRRGGGAAPAADDVTPEEGPERTSL